MSKRNPVAHALNHPTRRQIIAALWHGGEPLSATRFHSEYAGGRPMTVPMVGYHLRQLESAGIAEPDGESRDGKERYILGGPNSAEAIRCLQLTS